MVELQPREQGAAQPDKLIVGDHGVERVETGLHLDLANSGSSENPGIIMKNTMENLAHENEQASEESGGIEVFTNLFFGACGAINTESENVIVDDKKGVGVYVLDESAAAMKEEKKTEAGQKGARNAEAPRRTFGLSRGVPDRAALDVPPARDSSRLSSTIPTRLVTPPQPVGATNELHMIAKAGDWPKLREQLTSVANHSKTVALAGQVDEKGFTPLMLACMQGSKFPADVARLLLVANNQSASVYVLQKNNGKQFCLHVATSYGCNIEVLGILHGAYPKAISTVDGNGNMPLHLAVNNGRYRSIASQLEVRGEDIASTVIADYNQTDECVADITYASDNASKLTMGHDFDSESLSTPTHNFGVSSEDDMVNVCEMLISAYPSALTHRNRRGETPLLLAVYRRSPSDVLSLLLVRGGAAALKIADDFGYYPMHFCDRSPSLSLVRDMAELFPDAIEKKNNMGNTPLFSAMANVCDISFLRAMLEVCTKPRKTVESKNIDKINILQFGWDDLTTQVVVAAEDQDDEDERLEECRNLIENASSPSSISGTYLGCWWAKATLLLQAAYHNTIKVDGDNRYGGRLWRPVHAVAGTECPVGMVKFVLQIHADEAGAVDENQNTPLHVAASRPDIIGLETVKLVLDAHPSSALMQNNYGYSPLHVACLYKAPLEVIELLLSASPEATCLKNRKGQTALFISLSVGAPVGVLRALLEARPVSVHIRDENGISSIALAWHMLLSGKVFEERGMEKRSETRRSNANISSLAVISRSSSLKGDIRSWMSKIDLLLRAAFHGTVAECLPRGRQWRAVHAACSGGTVPPDVLAFALQILPSEADVPNESKDFPLHIAASAPPHEANCPAQLASGESIDLLLSINSTAARKTDRRGRLPVHLALNSGKTWSNGVRGLVEAFPESVRMRDPPTMLYPFMLAACSSVNNLWKGEDGSKCDIGDLDAMNNTEDTRLSADLAAVNTTFMLLRDAPDIVLSKQSNAEIAFLRRTRSELQHETDQLKEKISTIQMDLQKRMSPSELKDIEDKEKREISRQQEEKRRKRANHLELQVRQMKKTLSNLADAMMSLKDEGL